jgi:hypothetical protein
LVVILETFNTDGTCAADDLKTSNNGLTLASEWRWALALASCAGLALMEECRERDFFNGRVDVHDTVVTGGKDVLELKDTDLSLKGRNAMH